MIKVDLITGFLGSGKTTFLKEYAKFLMSKGQSVGIIENDYGAVNVDMMLLQDIEGDFCDLETVAGACDSDCHKRRLKSKLIAMGMRGYDRVIVEPSGIFDVDEFFDVLYEEPLDRWYEKGNVIAIVDSSLENNLSQNSEFLLASQVASSGIILLSKAQFANPTDIENTIEHINRSLAMFKCNRKINEKDILSKGWGSFLDEDYIKILNSGYKTESYVKIFGTDDLSFNSLYYMNMSLSEEDLIFKTKQILGDKNCGKVFRIKGFLQTDKNWLQINATQKNISVTPITVGQNIIIVIGENLNDDVIKSYWNKEN